MKYLSKILIAVTLMYSSISVAQNNRHLILDKTYTPSNSSTKLEIVNNFGNINLAVWNQNTIKVLIELEVEGYDDKEAKEILDKVSLNTSETASQISIKTNLKSHNSSSFRKKSFKINYEISLPDGHPLALSNEFGNIFITDYSGKTYIDLEYGNLTAGALGELELSHEFGKGEIEAVTKGNLRLDYVDEFSLSEASELELHAEFSKINIDNVRSIDFNLEYGKLIIGTVSNYSGTSEFSQISVNEVYDNFILNAEYASGTIEIKNVSKSIKKFELNTEFSKSEIIIEDGANLSFDTEHSFGKLNIEGENVKFTKKVKDMSDEEYQGTIGKQPDQIKTTMKITTNYGGCTIITNQ